MTVRQDRKRILVTGSQGYVGTELVRVLSEYGFNVSGLDSGLFSDCQVGEIDDTYHIRRDIRDITTPELRKFDCLIHLAALSNDPLGEFNVSLTYQINHRAAVDLAKKAKEAGVSRFIFVSTQSIYGISKPEIELSETSTKNPVTAYAKAKLLAETEILALKSSTFSPVAVRPSTVFGWGSRIRNDIIFNNLLYLGQKKGLIELNSNGSPIRPVVHILDVCEFLVQLVDFENREISGEAFNLGLFEGNYSVLEIAEIASNCLGNVDISITKNKSQDERSYRVSFLKAKEKLGFVARRCLKEEGMNIISKVKDLDASERDVYFNRAVRLRELQRNIERGIITKELRLV